MHVTYWLVCFVTLVNWPSLHFVSVSGSATTPIHIAPFLFPELEWDVSGHKYGLVCAGVGWVVWRSKEDLPDELIFHINYLGADQPTFTLNFSKASSQIIAQYYQFLRLGFEVRFII
jgi:hypothetical protein